jgi:hypothetical protein
MVVSGLLVLVLANVPHTLGGMKPTCVPVHWAAPELPREILHAIGADAGGSDWLMAATWKCPVTAPPRSRHVRSSDETGHGA